jgi:hypothetical protein
MRRITRILLVSSSSTQVAGTTCTSASVCNTYRCVHRCNTYRCVSLHPTHVYPHHTFASPRIHATHVYLQPPGLPATMQTRYNRYKSTPASATPRIACNHANPLQPLQIHLRICNPQDCLQLVWGIGIGHRGKP